MVGDVVVFKVFLDFPIGRDVGIAEHEFLRIPLELVADALYLPKQLVDVNVIREHQWVKSPDDMPHAQSVHQSFECVYSFR